MNITDPTHCPFGCRPGPRNFELANGDWLRWCRVCGSLWRRMFFNGREGAAVQRPDASGGTPAKFVPFAGGEP